VSRNVAPLLKDVCTGEPIEGEGFPWQHGSDVPKKIVVAIGDTTLASGDADNQRFLWDNHPHVSPRPRAAAISRLLAGPGGED
jgi:hypothetical protein